MEKQPMCVEKALNFAVCCMDSKQVAVIEDFVLAYSALTSRAPLSTRFSRMIGGLGKWGRFYWLFGKL